jgi:hypothetical protein
MLKNLTAERGPKKGIKEPHPAKQLSESLSSQNESKNDAPIQ